MTDPKATKPETEAIETVDEAALEAAAGAVRGVFDPSFTGGVFVSVSAVESDEVRPIRSKS